MRAFILAVLMACTVAQPAVAESTVAETYNTFRQEQEADYAALLELDEAIWAIVSKYDYFSEATAAEQELLVTAAQDALALIDHMRARGEVAFQEIESQYELFCLQSSDYFVLLCAPYRQYYKMLIVDTIVHGGTYWELTEYCDYILISLKAE